MILTYCVGIPGQSPRMFITCNEATVLANVKAGEVYFTQANIPPVPHIINADGTKVEAVIPSIDMRRAARWQEAKQHRSDVLNGGCSTPKGRVDSDEVSRTNLQSAIQADIAVNWVMADNSVVVMSPQELIAVGQAVATFINQCYLTSSAIRNSINASENPEAVSITDGYPS